MNPLNVSYIEDYTYKCCVDCTRLSEVNTYLAHSDFYFISALLLLAVIFFIFGTYFEKYYLSKRLK